MDDTAFDQALVAAAFTLIAERGWRRLSVAEAARAADLPLDRARARFACRAVVLMRFGALADRAALAGAPREGASRERLFDLMMRRIDVMQAHRAGVVALLRALPTDPPAALLLAAASLRSMGWMLEGAGIDATGPFGRLRAKGLLGVWLWTLRAWERDESPDLAATMAALDRALDQAERVGAWLGRRPAVPASEPAATVAEPPADAAAAPRRPDPSG